MRKVFMSRFLVVASFLVLSFQFSPVLNSANLAHSSINIAQSTVSQPNIDPVD